MKIHKKKVSRYIALATLGVMTAGSMAATTAPA